MTAKKEVIVSANAPKAVGPYSVGIQSGDFLFLSGQLGLVPGTGEFAAGGIEEQTRQALTNLQHVLAEKGATLEHVVKTTVFLSDMNDFSKMNAVYAEFFIKDPPARSTVEVGALPKFGMVEIDVIARI